jgi:hypothetical protein
MGKKMTRAGMEIRRAIRADIETNPSIDHLDLRRKYGVNEAIVESASTKVVTEWDAMIAATPNDLPVVKKEHFVDSIITNPISGPNSMISAKPSLMPGIEQGIIKFTRKPAKMGEDYIFWIPRVYLKNGLVDPRVEYEVYLKRK